MVYRHCDGYRTQNLIPAAITRPATPEDASLIHAIYSQTPQYFEIISILVPSLAEVTRELEAAAADPCRHTELLLSTDPICHLYGLQDPKSGQRVIGYLDYKLDYPDPLDVTINLLLVLEKLQNRGYGKSSMTDFERRMRGRARRVLASIYGQNQRAKRFWQALGYQFAIDAKPILEWYAKTLV